MTIAIVGTGPAGVSAAYCLLRKGLSITMLDVGYRLEPDRQQLVARLAASTPEHWEDDSLDALRKPMAPDVKGLPKKLVYGSDYPYRVPSELVDYEERAADLVISHALGGLSNIWGSNVLPFQQQDITDWPIRETDLAPYYRAIFSFVDLSAREDRLRDRFPLYTDTPRPLRPSRQAQRSWTTWNDTTSPCPEADSSMAPRGSPSAPRPGTEMRAASTAACAFTAVRTG